MTFSFPRQNNPEMAYDKTASIAGIFAAWRDFGTYRRFMESGHDELANQHRLTLKQSLVLQL